ncbi:MAG: AAA family ATPase [Bacteroidota bacterium]|nr:AAA family ATPase [Bacteroidota bacterium]
MKIKRVIQREIENHLTQKEISVITGTRQVGKTTMLLEIYEKLRKQGEPSMFLNLDNDITFFQKFYQ